MRSQHTLLALPLFGLLGCASSVGTDPALFDGPGAAQRADGVAFADVTGSRLATRGIDVAEDAYYHPERTFAVVMVEEGDVLNVREGAGTMHPIVGTLAPESVELTATGAEEMVGTQRWVEVLLPIEGQGWVNSYYLTELVTPAKFCEDAQVSDLLGELETAIRERDGERLFATVSPKHGLTVQLLANGARHRFDDEEARALFNDAQSFEWGTHPYTGETLSGSFGELVTPDLESVLAAPNSTVQCNDLVLGGHAYDVRLPTELANFNFYTLHFPGSAEYAGMDWSSWLVGVEYSEGVPYVVSLLHFAR